MEKRTTKLLDMTYHLVQNNAHTTAIVMDKWFVPPEGYVTLEIPGELFGQDPETDEFEYLSLGGAIVDPNLMPEDDTLILEVLTRPNTGSDFPIFYLTEHGWHIVSPVHSVLYSTGY